ncbi:MAG: enoyl-CoA hydratase [Sphingobium sp.]
MSEMDPQPIYETETPVLYETRGPVAIVTMNRPRYSNAQNNQMTYALDDALMRAAGDDDVAAIILCGAGRNFSGGHDLGTPGRDSHIPIADRRTPWWNAVGKPGVEQQYVREQEVYLGMCRRWRELPKPTIAAVQGACIAGGLMLAWMCDIIVASRDAFFLEPALSMGVPGVEYFAHAFEMSPRIAREFLLMGEKMDAERAYAVGMVNRLAQPETLMEEAMAVAERLATRSRFSLALAKQMMNFIDDVQGKRAAMDGAFAFHQLGHAHNQLSGESLIGRQTKDSMRDNTKDS